MTGIVRYTPGHVPVLVTRHGIVAIAGDAPASLIIRLWEDLAAGGGLAAVLEALTGAFGTSLSAIPPFVVALAEESSVRLAVRGPLTVRVESAAGAESISGAAVTTWSERVVTAATKVEITIDEKPDAAEPAFPVEGGVVLASRMEWLPVAVAETPKLVKKPEPVAVPGPEPMSEPVAAAESVVAAEPLSVAEPVVTPQTAQDVVEGDESAGPWAAFAVAPRLPVPEPIPVRGPKPTAPTADPAASTPGLIDSGAVLSMTSSDTLMPPELTLGSSDDGPNAAPADDPVWGATIARVGDAPSVDAPVGAGDHDGETISVAEARALKDSGQLDGGHAAHDSTPAPLAPPRPPAPGRLLLSTGQVLVLDRTVVIGRRPRSTRVTGTDLPHLVAVDSPQQDISRSHIELRVEGDAIVATDLHTTNGTTLHRAGAEPMRLHPGEATVVVPGDVIDLGDEITVTIEEIG